jgi:hypothetical protein
MVKRQARHDEEQHQGDACNTDKPENFSHGKTTLDESRLAMA